MTHQLYPAVVETTPTTSPSLRSALFVAFLVVLAVESPAQAAPVDTSRPRFLRTFIDAERDGAAWPRASRPDSALQWIDTRSRGTNERTCVSVGTGDHRSGEFTLGVQVGVIPTPQSRTAVDTAARRRADSAARAQGKSVLDFAAMITPSDGPPSVKISWSPRFSTRINVLEIRGALIGGAPGDTIVISGHMIYPVPGDPKVPANYAGPLGWASSMGAPKPGPWLFVAAAGPNWGCFIFTAR